MSIGIQKYTDLSIVIRGDTKARLNDIKSISGAKFGYFGGEPGWMFPASMETQVRRSLNIPGTSYVDGPKPSRRNEGIPYSGKQVQQVQQVQQQSVQQQSVQQQQVQPSIRVQQPVRGALRGRAPIDDEDTELETKNVQSFQSSQSPQFPQSTPSDKEETYSKKSSF